MALKLHSGILKEAVDIQQPTSTRDAKGDKETVFTTLLTTRAGVEDVNQFRAIEAGVPALIGAKFFYIRNRAALSSMSKDYRIGYNGGAWTIQSIEEPKEGWLKILAKNKNG